MKSSPIVFRSFSLVLLEFFKLFFCKLLSNLFELFFCRVGMLWSMILIKQMRLGNGLISKRYLFLMFCCNNTVTNFGFNSYIEWSNSEKCYKGITLNCDITRKNFITLKDDNIINHWKQMIFLILAPAPPFVKMNLKAKLYVFYNIMTMGMTTGIYNISSSSSLKPTPVSNPPVNLFYFGLILKLLPLLYLY